MTWISVKDRLPDTQLSYPGGKGPDGTMWGPIFASDRVLVFRADRKIEFDTLCRFDDGKTDPIWYINRHKVTHWMPLPQPPERAEGEG